MKNVLLAMAIVMVMPMTIIAAADLARFNNHSEKPLTQSQQVRLNQRLKLARRLALMQPSP